MTKISRILTGLILLLSSLAIAQPVNGVTTFFTNTTTALVANTSCVMTKTTSLDGWLFSVSSTSNCGFNHTSTTGGDGRLQYLVGFGTLTQASFGSNTGSEFALTSLVWGVSTSSWVAKPMTFVGYKNGMPVPGATLNATTPPGTGILNTVTVVFTGNAAFNDVDNITIAPNTTTCNSILFLETITVSTATPSCSGPTVSLSAQNNVACNGQSTGSATMSVVGGSGLTYTWSPSGGNAAIASNLPIGTYTLSAQNSTCSIINTQTVTITQPSALVTSTAVTNVACNGGSNGVGAISGSGGAGGYSYLWNTGAVTQVITGRPAGVYTATVTDANGCKASKSLVITQPSALVTTTAVTNVACNGGSNGVASITASGGAGGYSYFWSNSASTSAITGLMAGVYTATVTDANSCIAIKSAVITQPSALVTTTAVTNVACNGGSNGVASITASGGAGGYSYLWSNGASISAITGLMAGIYTATVTDANSCTSIKSAVITQPSALVTTTAVTNVACNGGSNGVASITASGGAGGYSYLWSNAGTTSAITGLMAGIYTATVTDANSCTSIKSAVITQPSALVTTTAVTNIACNGGSNGVASVTASGGAGGYTYLWSNGATTSTITGVMAGVYTATVTDANSCTSIKSAVITQPSALVTTTAVTNVACNGGSNGVASITASGGAGGYSYLWSNGASTSAITGLMAGVYTATVTDANSCTSIKSTVITQPSALVTTTALTNVACNGGNGSATITASGGAGGYTYLWSNGATTSVISVPAGVYTATVTDANSCTSSKNVTITQPSALITTTALTNVLCNGGNGSGTITASGGTGAYTYLWSNGATTSVITTIAGVYTATVTDANNCKSSKTITITQPSALTTNTAVTNVLCNGGNGSAAIIASGGTGAYTYLWSTGATTSVITNLAGVYTATVTDANSCTSSKNVTITQPSALVTITALTNVACNGGNGSATITASGGAGGYTYLWSNGATTSVISVPAGVYTATVTDANSCTSTKSFTITQPSALVTTTALTNVLCNGGNGSGTITASGGTGAYTYLWSNGATTSVITTIAGVYTATVTDANNCKSSKTITITQPSALTTNTAVTNVLCNGGNGSAAIIASGGAGAYTYLWSTGATTSVITNLAGVYTATVTDANSCTSSKNVTITQPSALVTTTALSNVLCNGGNGSATITASGGAGGYTYLWSNGATSSVITVPAGIYTATVTDANNCTSTKSFTITQPSALVTTTALTNVLCNGGNGSGTITASGGTGAYTYLWSTGATTSVITNLAGVYTATVTDANNCKSNNSITITQPSALATNTAVTNVLCNGGNGSAAIIASGGTGAYTYLWSTGATTSVITNLAGVYTATVTDANNCKSSKSITITQPSALATNTSVTHALCYGTTGSATVTASGGIGAYSYLWSNGATTPVVSNLNAGVYTATVTDANLCQNTRSVTVTVPSSITLIAAASSASICSGNASTLTATASGGTGLITYSWTTGVSNTVSIVSPTVSSVYTIEVKDANLCSTSLTVGVDVGYGPTIAVNSGSICAGESFSIAATGAVTYTYSGGSAVVMPGNTTSYTVTGTAANGCPDVSGVVSTVTVYALPVISIPDYTICAGETVTLAPGGANVYTITGGTPVVTPSATTVYSITGSSTEGCISAAPAISTVYVNMRPVISVNSGSICEGQTFTLVPSGASTYTFSSGIPVVSPTITTIYTVAGTGTNGCESYSAAVSEVTVYAIPNISVASGAICPGNSFTLAPSGASTYTYLNGGPVVTPTITSTYSVTGTSANGCVATTEATAVVTVTNTLFVSISGTDVICDGETAILTANGAATYSWSTNVLTPTISLSPSVTTSYTVYGVSGTCSNNAVYEVTVNPTPTLNVTGTNSLCAGQTTTLTVSGAATYTWDNGATTTAVVFSPSASINYTVTGTNTVNCSAAFISPVTVYALPTITVADGSICAGASFTIVPSGAANYTYSSGSGIVTPSSTSSYSITGESAEGCAASNTAVVSVTVNALPLVSGSVDKQVICAGQSVVFTGSGADTYTWTGGVSNGIPFYPTFNSTYSVSGTNTLTGCASTNMATQQVTVNALPSLTVVSQSSLICAGETVSLTVSGADTYTWSTASTDTIITIAPTQATSYTVTGTNANACINSQVYTQDVSDCTGLGAVSKTASFFQLYPNPNSGVFTIELPFGGQMVIMDVIGQVVSSEMLTAGKHNITLQGQANGVYFIQVISEKRSQTIRMIKQ